ncbi:MAG: response regulator [Planctomycetota bacterium]|jgi:FixJ family two-component response regulator
MDKPVVFIIDDDESVCRALRRLIKSVGYNVRTFTSAKDFLNQGCQNMPGCLILDVKMPGMGGLELQDKLVESGSRMPIILMSAHEDISISGEESQTRAIAFLRKPFEDHVIVEKVSSALSRFANEDKNQGRKKMINSNRV